MLFQIKGRFSGLVQAAVEITCAHNTSEVTKLGKAVIKAVSEHANLYGANLGGADLYGADLGGVNLYGANLAGANLGGANLYGANLGGADLYGADLGGANLGGADLGRANLAGANLGGANLYGADLGGAVSKVVKLVSVVQRSDGYMFFGFVKDDNTLGIVAGCQNRTLVTYRHHVKADYSSRLNGVALVAETTDILDFLEKRHAAMEKTI